MMPIAFCNGLIIGKTYDSGATFKNEKEVSILNAPQFSGHSYMEARPAIQLIFSSNTRLDVSCGLPVYGKSYSRFYPVFYLNIQRYFYF